MTSKSVIPKNLPDFGPSAARDVRYQWELFWEANSFSLGPRDKRGNLFLQDDDPRWAVCITCCWHDSILARKVLQRRPTPSELWDILLEAIQHPEVGEPQRPKRLYVMAKEGWHYLKSRLAKIGIRLVTTKELDFPDGFPEWCDRELQRWEKQRKKRKSK